MKGQATTQTNLIEYPTRDGQPMGETDDHRDEMKDYAINVFKDHFRNDPMVYVSGNNFLYYVEGSPSDCVCPDVYVVKGVPNRQRDLFKVWEEGGHVPCFVLEVTSKSTRLQDLGDKMAKYRDVLGVLDYFLFDPRRDWVAGGLRGFALQAGVYQPVSPAASGRLHSDALGLDLGAEGGHIRFYLPNAAAPLPTREEEILRLRAELERLRRGTSDPA